MKKRQSVIRDHACVVKVKCWRKLLAIAMDKEINANTIAAMEAIINIAEPVNQREVDDNGLRDNG